MILRIVHPQYGGTFTTEPAFAPLRFVLPGEDVSPDPFTILNPAPDRTIPRCPHFGTCGGCDYQHASYLSQLDLKRTILHDTLSAAGLSIPSSVEVHAADPWLYRNRIRLRIEQTEGTFRFGYNLRGSRDFLPVTECPIAAPLLLRAANALLKACQTLPAAPWLPLIAEVELQTNGTAIQATFLTRKNRVPGFEILCKVLLQQLPELTGAGWLPVQAGYGAKERGCWGASGLLHRVLDRTYWLTRGAFFQINSGLLPAMVNLVTGGRAGSLAWDLYAGAGLFSRALADSFAQVVAVESGASAASDLASSAHGARKKHSLQPVHASVADFLRTALLQRDRPDLIVMDPPRAGLGPEVCALLERIAAPEMVYVSCDPVTLAQDLTSLVTSGYSLQEVHLLDMFPQTYHIETVVYLQR